MPIIDSHHHFRLESIVVDGRRYNLHVSIHDGIAHSAVISLSPAGGYLPFAKWAAGIRAADEKLGDTSARSGQHIYLYCALFIKQDNESVQIRTREYYLIDVGGSSN